MATALGISSLGTICGSRAMRLGRSKALRHPDKKAKVMTCHNAIHPMITRVAIMKKMEAEPSWERIMMRLRSMRSAMTPPMRVNAIVGMAKASPVNPSRSGELVSSNTNQLWAIPSMFCASTEESCPSQ